jgi:hypothetical protein
MQCWKKPYQTWQHASFDAKRIREKIGERTAEPYVCRNCGQIHVGTRRLHTTGGAFSDSPPPFRKKAKLRNKRVIVDD